MAIDEDYKQWLRSRAPHAPGLYWNKAFAAYEQTMKMAKAAGHADSLMKYWYMGGNFLGFAGVFFSVITRVAPCAAIVWNLVDIAGTGVLAAKEGKDLDKVAMGYNAASAAQMIFFTTWGAGIQFQKQLHTGFMSQGINSGLASALAVGFIGFSFAAAMFFSCRKEHREVQLCKKRIKALEEALIHLQPGERSVHLSFNQLLASYHQAKSDDEKLETLQSLIEFDHKGNEPANYQHTKQTFHFLQHQILSKRRHQRARNSWGFCGVAMTIVAGIAFCGALGAAAAATVTVGIVAAGLAMASAIYRVCSGRKAKLKEESVPLQKEPAPEPVYSPRLGR